MRILQLPLPFLFTALSLVLAALPLSAQYNADFLNYGKTGRSISANFEFEAGTDGFSSALANKLIWGGYIDKQLKDDASGHLKGRNNFGLMLNYGMNAIVKGGKKLDYLVGFRNQEVFNASYSRDFFNLMFYGNQMYRGQTASLGNCNINALRFQEIKFGAMMQHVDSVGKIGISVSLLKGEQLFYVNTLQNSSLYTSEDGRELVFTSNFNMALSDTNRKGITGFNGIGASADLYFETPYKGKLGKRSVLIANANNLGFIHWWKNSVQYNSDSTLRFSGYNINSISDLRDSTLSRINTDSVLRDLTNARNEDFNVNIPTNLIIINKVYFGQELFALSLGYRYIFNANYRSYFFLEPEYRRGDWIFTLHAGYGGYTRLNMGGSVTYNSEHWFCRLGSNALQGYFLPKSTYAQSLFFTLAVKLK